MLYRRMGMGGLALGFAVAACNTPIEVEDELPSDAVPLEVRPVDAPGANHYTSGVQGRTRAVIRDEGAWAGYWAGVMRLTTPKPPLPEIDFESEMVLGATMGVQGSDGHSIHIDDVSEARGRLYVTVREVSPREGCPVQAVLTSPVTTVRVARRPGQVTFLERKGERRC